MPVSSKPLIILDRVSRYYVEGEIVTHALQTVSLEINRGEFVAIMGPSGSGKSTLLHVLCFLDRPTSGKYAFMGKRMKDLSDQELARVRNKEMGFVFQAFNLLARSSVYENVEMPLLYTPDIKPIARAERVAKAVESVGLADKLYTEAGRLSGGQKQRVAIARALVNNPSVVFADEPTGNLDSHSGAQIMNIFEDLNSAGRTIILVTHETYTAEFANRILRLKDGEVESDEKVKRRRTSKEAFIK